MNYLKVLIITYDFHLDQSPRSFRATELAKQFCRDGHEVTVMAPHKEGIDLFTKEYPVDFISLGQMKWKIYNTSSLGKLGQLYNQFVNRLLPLLLEFPLIELFFKVRKAIRNDHNRYDILISIAAPYPIHWGVAASWKSKGFRVADKWIADCGDPYCLQENDTFKPPFYFRWIEKWFMRKVDFITVPTENSVKGYFSEFHPKIRVIPQGFRFEDIEKRSIIDDGVLRFGYGGIFLPKKRDPKEFVNYLTSLPKELNYEFHVYTSTPQFIIPYVGDDKRIIIHPPINRKNLLETFSTFKFVVNFANKGTVQTPSKLIDYAIIEKPILNIETDNLDIKTIQAFFSGNYMNSLKVKNINNYRIENIANAILNLK